ncbi:MAG: M1 family peptidase, partial [Mucilaginibacter sp.]|nr:M1 family peptidase [Mucilaginibacter sp.]
FFTNGYDDLAVKNVVTGKDGYTFTVANVGGFAIPFDVVVEYADGTKNTIHQTPVVWEKNQKETLVTFKNERGKSLKSITLDNGIFMDATPADNVWMPKK